MSKGAFRYSDVAPGAKCMSSTRGALKTAQGRMSSAHGVVKPDHNNNMNQGGSNRVGADCRGFKSGIPGEAGYKGGGTAHGKQPKGHKSEA